MKRLTIYTTTYCSYCDRAKALLRRLGVPFMEIDATDRAELRRWLVERTGRRTVPQIFVGEAPIGGYDDLAALHSRGELLPLLEDEALS